MKIALLEENTRDAEKISGWLRAAGCTVVEYASGEEFIAKVPQDACHLLIVGGCDTAKSGVDGTEVLWWVRENLSATIPVLRVSEHTSELDIVAALKAGADDCVVKPPRKMEFLARVEALHRRTAHALHPSDGLNFGSLRVDMTNRVILRDGTRVALTPKSYDLAVLLLSNRGQLLTRGYLMEGIWGYNAATTRTLDTHISRLRSDLGLTPENGWQLQAVYQHGYRLEQLGQHELLESRAA